MNIEQTVSLCMIVKNEADCLLSSIRSVQNLIDEIIVIDTGSTDGTPQLAQEIGASVYHFDWIKDFSAARNFSLRHASSDWILVLDADEVLEEVDPSSFLELLTNDQVEGYYLKIINILELTLGQSEDQVVRLFRNKSEYQFEGAIHEQITPSILRWNNGQGIAPAPLTIHHSGYRKNRLISKDKFNRNREIIQNELLKDSSNPFLLYCLGLEYYQQNLIEDGLDYLTKALVLLSGREGYFEDVLLNIALGYLHLDKINQLINFLSKVLAMFPDHTDFLFLRGLAHFYCKNYRQATLDLNRCLQIGTPKLVTIDKAESLLKNARYASAKERRETPSMKHRILIASPVKQTAGILSEFLASLAQLKTTNMEVHFAFIDDYNDHDLLFQFAQEHPNVRIYPSESKENYLCDETTHHWHEDIIWKVARFKERFLKLALDETFDYLFLVDSDLFIHPNTLQHLLTLNKDIVSEVFWTRWKPNLIPLPQVWVRDQYTLYYSEREESLTEEEITGRTQNFIQTLSQPGTYKVGGLGACTLISRHALERGVSFQEIYNLGFTGEDRHFCIRAGAIGLELYADTHYPPFHIYRESELEKLELFKKNLNFNKIELREYENKSSKNLSIKNGEITLAMLVRNESGRYLETVLNQAQEYIDQAVILDDASDDDTVSLCHEILQGIPLTLHSNKKTMFNNEVYLRKQLWEMALSSKSEWIVILDADELFEKDAPRQLKELLKHSKDVDVYSFRLYDFWTESHYREDLHWQAHRWYRPFIIRNIQDFLATWQETPQHCGRFPVNIRELRGAASPLRVKHLGWIKPQDRLAKYYRYKQLDPDGIFGNLEQYQSILDPTPNLIPWET